MRYTQIHGGRKTKMYGRAAQLSLNNIKKGLQDKSRKEREEIVRVVPELQNIGFSEDEILKTEFLFSSDTIGRDYNLHALILGFRKKDNREFYISVKNYESQILRLVPKKIVYCEGETKNIRLLMNIDRNSKEENKDGTIFWHNYIRNSSPEERTVYLGKLTHDPKVDAFAVSALKQLAQPDYATRLEKCSDIKDYLKEYNLKERDFTSFIL